MDESKRPLVVLTGSSGMLGAALAQALSGDYEVVGLDRSTGRAHCEEIEADLTSSASLEKAMTTLRERHGKRIAAVVHLAAYYDFSGQPHPLYERLNVDGRRLQLDAVRSVEVERFVCAGTILGLALMALSSPRGAIGNSCGALTARLV